ncbi:MAG: TIGR00730 family Rossman fold protein [Telmatospirillum sp.]|nr:TIGR00730 family Rossman fold protein [Telmatospirillum sp.]
MIIGIFCGSSSGSDGIYLEAARQTGRALAEQGIGIVYGGGRVGLMGAVAESALSAGGRVVGVIPRALADAELAHKGLTDLHVVGSMHERKAKMSDIADAFIALPGGPGTLEEIFEQWTWGQLWIHQKPCGLLNVNGYFDPLKAMIERMVVDGFMRRDHGDMLALSGDVGRILDHFRAYVPPPRKW